MADRPRSVRVAGSLRSSQSLCFIGIGLRAQESRRLTAIWPLKSLVAPRNSVDFLFVKVVTIGTFDPCLFDCVAFFHSGLQQGCTKQLFRVGAGWPFAWAGQL